MSLESLLASIASRAERFKELKEAFSRGEYSMTIGPEVNDFSSLSDNSYQEDLDGIEIPSRLVDEAKRILTETYQLGFGPFRSPPETERRLKQTRFIEYFRRCEVLEMDLYQILSNYSKQH